MKKLQMIMALMLAMLCIAAAGGASSQTAVTFTAEGEKTQGITYALNDVYFDGSLLVLPIVQTANDAGFAVYNDVLGDYEAEHSVQGMEPIGSYCESFVSDDAGNDVSALYAGYGRTDGAAQIKTELYLFPPEQGRDSVNVKIVYGVMEEPGQPVGELNSYNIAVSAQGNAVVRTIEPQDDAQAACFDKIVYAQTDAWTSVFVYYTADRVRQMLLTDALEHPALATPISAFDAERGEGVHGFVVPETEGLDTLHIRALDSLTEFALNLQEATVNGL